MAGFRVHADVSGRRAAVLPAGALYFLQALHERFDPETAQLFADRPTIAHRPWIRMSDWRLSPPPYDLLNRRVEFSGAADPERLREVLRTDANVYVADLENSMLPVWHDISAAHLSLTEALSRPHGTTLMVRPRSLERREAHVTVNGLPMCAALFDFALVCFHNGRALNARGSGPLFCLSALRNCTEARLWNDMFGFAENYMGLAHGTVRAVIGLDDAAFAVAEEALFELRSHAVGLKGSRAQGAVVLDICRRRSASAVIDGTWFSNSIDNRSVFKPNILTAALS